MVFLENRLKAVRTLQLPKGRVNRRFNRMQHPNQGERAKNFSLCRQLSSRNTSGSNQGVSSTCEKAKVK
jgi:hypothetical protein